MGLLRSVMEQRAIPRSGYGEPAAFLTDLFGGRASLAGTSVTPETATAAPAVLNAVTLIAKTIASLPLHLLKKRSDRGTDEAREHPLFRLVCQQPNPLMTSFEFRELLAVHLELWGNFFAHIETSRAGRIVGLWPLHPSQVTMLLSPDRRQAFYEWQPARGGVEVFTAEEVFHIRGMNSNGYLGQSAIAVARESIGLTLAAEETAAAFYGNDAAPGGVLEHPKALSDEAYKRLKATWNARFQGPRKKGLMAILEEGTTWKTVAMPLKDAQFIETRKFQIEEVARIFDLPPHKLKSLDRATFSNIEHQGIEFLVDSMGPRFVRIEQRLNADLLSESEVERGLFFRFRLEGRLRGDMKARYESYALARQWGWLSTNDIRELEDLNPLPGDEGDDYLVPLNMLPAGGATPPAKPPAATPPRTPGAAPAAPEPDADDEERTSPAAILLGQSVHVLADAFQRCARKESLALRRQLERDGTGADLAAWHEAFWVDHRALVRDALLPACRMLAGAFGRPEGEELARALAEASTAREQVATRAALTTALAQGPDAVRALLDQWDSTRARDAARRERYELLQTLTPRGLAA